MNNTEGAIDKNMPDENAEAGESWYERLALTVDKGQEPLRIDKFLIARIGESGSRNKIQQAIARGMIQVNGKTVKANYKIKPFDQIVYFSENTPEEFEVVAEPMDLPIVYEDKDILVINKPAGLVVHPGNGNYSGTLLNGVAWHLREQQPGLTETELHRFGLVHRIDKNTSGLLLMAKTDKASRDLANQFFEHTVIRRYHALVWGDFDEDEGTITGHVGRHQRFRKIMDVFPDGEHGKEAVTHYRVLERFRYVSLVECRLETGRTHQIRVHMQHIGHPLFNDDTYGGDKIVKGTIYSKYKQFVENCFALCPRQALHAKTLGFIHPTTRKEIFFDSDLAADMLAVISKWRNYISGIKSGE